MKTFKKLKEDISDMVNPYMLWKNKSPVKYAMHLSETFGPPTELTPFRAIWYDKDGVKRIVIKDEYILHGSPSPHYDFVYSYVDLKVPHEFAESLVNSSESILIDFLKNEVGARCGSLTANAVTINYVLDVVYGRVKPSKEEYEKRINEMTDMFDKGKIYTNSWWPDDTKDADPDNPYYKEGSIEEAAPVIGGVKMKKLGKGKPGSYKSLVSRHLGAAAAEKIDKSDGSKLVAKGKKTGNKDLVRKGNFIKNVISR